ncbi:MAG: hypothetical protein NT027_05750 [Proteobacteria bacterium]|nr:hypothetical protein [Pseudomonadota bacterium]
MRFFDRNFFASIRDIFVSAMIGVTLSLSLAGIIVYHHLVESTHRARENAPSSFTAPILSETPSMSQESIEQAIEKFQIQLPENVMLPKFDPSLTDRGMTYRVNAYSAPQVSIGPEAFHNWAILASTIAHEVEVHCKQNFFAIHLMDLAGMDGTGQAEREAYLHELSHAKRFGLAPLDQDLIRSTMVQFYPESRFSFAEIPSIKFVIQKLSILEPTRVSSKSRKG